MASGNKTDTCVQINSMTYNITHTHRAKRAIQFYNKTLTDRDKDIY